MTQILALVCIATGFVLWIVTDNKLLLEAIGYGGPKLIDFIVGLSGMFFWKFIANMIWSYFYSTLATVIICARIVGWCFKDYHQIFLGPGEDDRSNLWKTNVYEREYYAAVPAPKETNDKVSSTEARGAGLSQTADVSHPILSFPTELQSGQRNVSMQPQTIQYEMPQEPPRGAVASRWQPAQQPNSSASDDHLGVRSLVRGSVV